MQTECSSAYMNCSSRAPCAFFRNNSIYCLITSASRFLPPYFALPPFWSQSQLHAVIQFPYASPLPILNN